MKANSGETVYFGLLIYGPQLSTMEGGTAMITCPVPKAVLKIIFLVIYKHIVLLGIELSPDGTQLQAYMVVVNNHSGVFNLIHST
jgi:hypothetical protein